MWFLIKGTFWFSLVLVLLPFLNAESSATLEKGPTVQLGDTFSAASEAINYVTAICLEKPDVCEKGSETFVALGHRAREGAYVAYQILDSQFADDGKAETAAPGMPMKPATVKPAIAAAETKPAAEPATISEIITGTVTPEPRPKNGNGPKPYTPPKL